MKVKKLIKKLQKLNPEKEVFTNDEGEAVFDIVVEECTINISDDNLEDEDNTTKDVVLITPTDNKNGHDMYL